MNFGGFRRFYSGHRVAISRSLLIISKLGALSCAATAWLEPSYRLTSLAAAGLCLAGGLGQWRARLTSGWSRP